MMQCDPVTGSCRLPDAGQPAPSTSSSQNGGGTLHYIGDPMCSWCWGISPAIGQLAALCAAEGIGFSITMGGLRPGGGDPWDAGFRHFLLTEWQHIARVTGQPFGLSLLEAPHFNYDTEPACRAVVTLQTLQARMGLAPGIVLDGLAAIQRKFYVKGQDPGEVTFYAEVCASLGLAFDAFRPLFESADMLAATRQSFVRAREWGVGAFPTLMFEKNGKRTVLATGYVTAERAMARLRRAMSTQ